MAAVWAAFAALLAPAVALLEDHVDEFVVYTTPIALHFGQVHNHPVKADLPDWVIKKYAGKEMGVLKFQLDIVDRPGGPGERSMPLSEMYNHHTIEAMGRGDVIDHVYSVWNRADPLAPSTPHCGTVLAFPFMDGDGRIVSKWTPDGPSMWVGPSGGAEYRDADRDLVHPYRQVVYSPEKMLAIMHLINIRGAPYGSHDWPRIYECPCTSARRINVQNNTIDGAKVLPFHCTQALIDQRNPSCSLATYQGGYRCCQHNDFVTEEETQHHQPQVVYGKWTFHAVGTEKSTQPVIAGAFDVAGGNAEYDVPACNQPVQQQGNHIEGCVHIASTTQSVSLAMEISEEMLAECPNGYMELVHAHGHQHAAGLGMELYDDAGQLLCSSLPYYNKDGFIQGIPPCVWGPPPYVAPPILRWNSSIFMTSRYNSSEAHFGVMGIWFVQVAHHCGNTSAALAATPQTRQFTGFI